MKGMWTALAGLAVVGLLALTGCIASGAKAWTIGEEDRTMYHHADDFAIKSEIRNKYLDETMLMDISTDVYEGRVLLTGAVTKAEEKRKAEEIARQVKGTREVFNDIQLTDEGGVKATAEDLTIVTKLHYKLLAAKGVSSVNFRLRAVNGVVYLLGIAQSQGELDKVLGIIRETDGVRQVISHMQIKPA
jgi:osmotically-inducible protein OsmY